MDKVFSLDKLNPFEGSKPSKVEIRSFYSNCEEIPTKHSFGYIKPLLLGRNTLIQNNYFSYAKIFRIALSKVTPSILHPQAFIICRNGLGSVFIRKPVLTSIARDGIKFKILKSKKSFKKIKSHVIILSAQLFLDLLKTHHLFKYAKICVFVEEINLDLHDLHEICYQLPQNIQRCLIVKNLLLREIEFAYNCFRNPIISIKGTSDLDLQYLKQYYLYIEYPERKLIYLAELLDYLDNLYGRPSNQGIIYANEDYFDVIINLLIGKGYSYFSIKSSMNYLDCAKEIQKFLEGPAGFLISSKPIIYYCQYIEKKMIINYSFPLASGEYLERVGNHGRFSWGVCLSLTDSNELISLKNIEEYYNTGITRFPKEYN